MQLSRRRVILYARRYTAQSYGRRGASVAPQRTHNPVSKAALSATIKPAGSPTA